MSALAEALLAAQSELPTAIPRDAQGQGYRYLTLDALIAAEEDTDAAPRDESDVPF